jgi:hypothetical protein
MAYESTWRTSLRSHCCESSNNDDLLEKLKKEERKKEFTGEERE